MEKIRLIKPSLEMKKSAMAFRQEFFHHGENEINGSCEFDRWEDYAGWLEHLRRVSEDREEGRLPSSTYFAFRQPDNAIVGIVDVRHFLTKERYQNGHIGYSVRPGERKKGYGTEILRLALEKAHELGIMEVYVSCDKNNAASLKVIRRNGLEKKDELREENGNMIYVFSK
jgi:predicted acetyltransferase